MASKKKPISDAEAAGQFAGAGVLGVVANVMKCVSDVMDVIERHHQDRMKTHADEMAMREKEFVQREEKEEHEEYFREKLIDYTVYLQEHRTDVGGGPGKSG